MFKIKFYKNRLQRYIFFLKTIYFFDFYFLFFFKIISFFLKFACFFVPLLFI